MEVRILGAHCIEAEGMRMSSILIDDILALDAGGLTGGLSLTAQQKIRAIFLTHPHFDHSRDLVALGANCGMISDPVKVYALNNTIDIVTSCLLDGRMYIDFSKYPSKEKPFLQMETIEPLEARTVEGYEVLAVPVNHFVSSIGFQITSNGKSLFYTGDTGPDLSRCWETISPQLLLIEVSGINESEEFLRKVGHLSAKLLKEELIQFHRIKEYFPRVIVIHVTPRYEDVIRKEVQEASSELGTSIEIGYEGMEISL
jgi:cAMP phosphodiesterase